MIISLIVEKLLIYFSNFIKDNFSPVYLSLYHVSSPGLISNFLDHVFPILFSAHSSTPSWTCCLVDKVLNLPEQLHHRLLGLMSTRLETCFFFDIFSFSGHVMALSDTAANGSACWMICHLMLC